MHCYNTKKKACGYLSLNVQTNNVNQPMVQMMPVLRAVVGSESMSSRHMCSRKVSAMAALSCCVWMKAEPMSRDFDWGISISGATGEVLRKKEKMRKNEVHLDDNVNVTNSSLLWTAVGATLQNLTAILQVYQVNQISN